MTPAAIPWKRTLTEAGYGFTIVVYVFGPLLRIDQRSTTNQQVRRRFYDHRGHCYKTEGALVAHMNRLAKEHQ